MPRAELLKIDWNEQLRAFHKLRTKARSAGVHLSDVISRIVKKIQPNRYGDGPIDPALAHQGFVWEDALSAIFAKQFGGAAQLEGEVDGILMTLDGHRAPSSISRIIGIPSAPRGRVLEFKFSKMSAANNITSQAFRPWMLRTMGYCKLMDTDEAEIVVMFINGSYELGGGRFGTTVPKGWVVRFSKVELKETWDWIQRERDELEKELRKGGRILNIRHARDDDDY